jgi:hypothetical protein
VTLCRLIIKIYQINSFWLRSVNLTSKSKRNKETRTMAKRRVASDATGGQDNPGVTTEVNTLIDPSGAPDETFDPTVPIVCSSIIAYIIKLCKFPEDSTMLEYIDQQGWTELIHLTTIILDEVRDFHMVRDDGVTYSTKPMLIHLCISCCISNVSVANCSQRFWNMTLRMVLVILGLRSIAVWMIIMMT